MPVGIAIFGKERACVRTQDHLLKHRRIDEKGVCRKLVTVKYDFVLTEGTTGSSTRVVNPSPFLVGTAHTLAWDETISYQRVADLCASTHLSVLPLGIVVAPSLTLVRAWLRIAISRD